MSRNENNNSGFESTIETLTPQQRDRARMLHERALSRTWRRRAGAVLLFAAGNLLLWWALFPDVWW